MLNTNALVTVNQLRDWVPMDPGRALSDWDQRFESAINAASNRLERRVRGGMPIRKVTHTAEVVRSDGGRLLRLPHVPILTVAAVTSTDGAAIDSTNYEIAASRTALRYLGPGETSEATGTWPQGVLLVTWDGGYDPIPEEFSFACCMLAHAILLGKGKDPRVQQERGRDYSIDRSSVDVRTGLPLDVLDLVKDYLYSDIGGVPAEG